MRSGLRHWIVFAAMCVASPVSTEAQTRPSTLESFRIGSGGDSLCRVELTADARAATGLFDRSYAIVCRDAVTAIGRVYVIRSDLASALARVRATRAEPAECGAPGSVALALVGSAERQACVRGDGASYLVYGIVKGRAAYVAEGLAGYRSAIELAFRSVAADRILDGPIEIATTEVGDPAAFARAQAGSLDRERALVEGYRRNNAGSFAEASEFFDTLRVQPVAANGPGEYLINQALQQSNLGDFDRADALFAQALALPSNDPVILRLRRNFLAIDRLNRHDMAGAMAELDRPVASGPPPPANAEIDAATARALNASAPVGRQIGLTDVEKLTAGERAALLDAQALALRGAILRRQGKSGEARRALAAALVGLGNVRFGRVVSVTPIRADILTEQAALAEQASDLPGARGLLDEAIAVLVAQYPDTAIVTIANARLAGFLARHGDAAAAMALYRDVVAALGRQGGSAAASSGALLEPYFKLLAARAPGDPAAMSDLFLATQTLVRPGVADTQAVLARELSAGDGEAARLFRQSTTLTREARSLQVEIARLTALDKPAAAEVDRLTAARTELSDAETTQAATQSRLAAYPSYRVVGGRPLGIDDLRASLAADEGYWKMAIVGRSIIGVFVTKTDATAWTVPLTAAELNARVDALRDTIAKPQGDKVVTYPFDVAAARALYVALAGSAAARIAATPHLVFEPDGAMQRLPAALLITDDGGITAYLTRIATPDADPFDLRGIGWLGAKSAISTAVSARAFRDGRNAPRSAANRPYLGMGENAPVPTMQLLAGPAAAPGPIDCRWPYSAWSRPISADELITARRLIGGAGEIETGAQFTDDAVMQRRDLAQFRILHFATHGLISGPLPQCAAQPALLTSFGGAGSDGLLSFREIYDLKLDADLVILSACDTAAAASVSASRAAGLTTGGGAALDGLVRAFVGAGSRAVLASHWPAPDDYDATNRLITGLFAARPGTGVADALKAAQRPLMESAATSHPYYWAGFVLVGDGARPVRAR